MLIDVGTNTEVVLAGRGRILDRELSRRPGLRGRRGDLRDAGRRGRDRDAAARAATAPSRSRRSATRRRSASAAPASSTCWRCSAATGRMTPKGVFADRARDDRRRPRGGHHVLARRRLRAGPGEGRQHGRPVDPAARARRRPGRRRPPVPRRRLRVLRRRPRTRSTSASSRRCPSTASRRSATRRCAARAGSCSRATARARLAELLPRIEHVELETTPDFFELFVDALPVQAAARPSSPQGERDDDRTRTGRSS